MLARAALAALLALASTASLATPQERNVTDMWLNPAESGWGLNVIHHSFTGTYFGHQVADASDPRAGTAESMLIAIDDNGPGFVMHTNAASGTCDYTAPAAQYDDLRVMNGTYSCSNGRSGAFTMSNATVSFDGFTAHFQGNGIVSGHMEGVRREANSPDAP